MTATIAALDTNEVDAFRELLALFAEVFAEDEDEAGETPIPERDYLAKVLADPDFAVVVARAEAGAVIGGLTLRFWHSYKEPGEECYLYDLAVHHKHRRQKIAARLLEDAIALAKARGAIAMWVQAEADDEDAVGFYRSLKQSELDVNHFELL